MKRARRPRKGKEDERPEVSLKWARDHTERVPNGWQPQISVHGLWRRPFRDNVVALLSVALDRHRTHIGRLPLELLCRLIEFHSHWHVAPRDYRVVREERQFGSWGAEDGQFSYPGGLVVTRREQVIVADTHNDCIHVVDTLGNTTGRYRPHEAYVEKFRPVGVALSGDEASVYVTDAQSSEVWTMRLSDGLFVHFCAPGTVDKPEGIAVTRDGDVVVCEPEIARIQVSAVDAQASFRTSVLSSRNGDLRSAIDTFGPGWPPAMEPAQIAIMDDGNFVVSDESNSHDNALVIITPAGQYVRHMSLGLAHVRGIAIDGRGDLVVAAKGRLAVLTPDGRAVWAVGTDGRSRFFSFLLGVTVAPDGDIVVSDRHNIAVF